MRSHSLDAALKALATQYTATVPAETLALFPRWHGELLPAITEQEPPEIRARIDELEEAARRSSTPESALGYIFSINALQAALDIHEFYGRGSSAGSASATAWRSAAAVCGSTAVYRQRKASAPVGAKLAPSTRNVLVASTLKYGPSVAAPTA